jgi:acyl-lipid omega-6 desaturase (Delta-12 desaturase)
MLEMTNPHSRPVQGNEWLGRLAPYRGANVRRSLWELMITVVPLVLLWATAWAALSQSIWLALALTIPAAGFLVRLFMIQHDCGHGTFFRRRSSNDWLGRVLGVLTLTPYDVWQRSHAVHHATTGNLDHRGTGDILTLTVDEYQALSSQGRLLYQLYRHPIVLFGLGPAFLFVLQHRLPLGYFRAGWRYWVSAMGTNVGIAIFVAAMIWLVGLEAFLWVHLPIVILAATAGVWLFYIQHQFEDTHWRKGADWDLHDAALAGSSYYELPVPLQWISANIGMHQVHHLCSRIPFYRLPDVVRDYPELSDGKRITLIEGFNCSRLKLWCPRRDRLVTFREIEHDRTAGPRS